MREGGRWGGGGNSSVKAGGKEILRKVSSRWYNFTHGPYINYFCVHEAVYRQWIRPVARLFKRGVHIEM